VMYPVSSHWLCLQGFEVDPENWTGS
jgi:hypothetical protein